MKLTIHANIASLLQDLVYLSQAWLMQKKVYHLELAKMLVLVGSSGNKLDIGPKLQTDMHASNIMHVYAYILHTYIHTSLALMQHMQHNQHVYTHASIALMQA